MCVCMPEEQELQAWECISTNHIVDMYHSGTHLTGLIGWVRSKEKVHFPSNTRLTPNCFIVTQILRWWVGGGNIAATFVNINMNGQALAIPHRVPQSNLFCTLRVLKTVVICNYINNSHIQFIVMTNYETLTILSYSVCFVAHTISRRHSSSIFQTTIRDGL